MPQWQKPENALRRANELLEVGKKQDALDTLHDVIKARKHRTWTKVHELIMAKHLELCVELRKPHLAKDGLFQYRNMCQQVNVKSLEEVITSFLDLAEKKAEQARQASHGLVEEVAEDLDQAESPERILLSAVSGEGAQDRADRSVLSPWLRFLWESYRQCLELLRNHTQVEQLYHKVAKQAFHFCLKYQRRAEFRKLTDNLRTHVNQIQKSYHSQYAVKLSNLDTLGMHQETRLIQLDVAIQMELWQEAFKSAEDVHQLIQLMQHAKKSAKAQTLASYYEKLALIFWKAGNTLYHTAALFKLFQLYKELKRSFSIEEASHLATRVLLATLSIRWSDQVNDLARHLEMEDTHLEHQRRLASLLSWPTPPTRQFLLKELQRINVIGLALQPAQQLHQWLECEFSPLKMATEVQRYFEAIKASDKPEYGQYVPALQQVAALKILKQVSQVYRSISLERVLAIVPFFDVFYLERLIVAAGKKAQMQVRIDHRTGSVEFGVGEGLTLGSEQDAGSAQLDVPVVQTMPNEQIRQYLQQMFAVLRDSVTAVDTESKEALLAKLHQHITLYRYNIKDEHKHVGERKKAIEAYKEQVERIRNEQEEQARIQENREKEQKFRDDQARLALEKQERQEERALRERKAFERKMVEDRVGRIADPKIKSMIKDSENQDVSPDQILQLQIAHMEKEKREQLAKLKQQEKKWDYYVRAIHMEEIPLREEDYKENSVKDRQMWEEHETERIQRDEEEHYIKLENHQRLARIDQDAQVFLAGVRQSRVSEMKKRMEDWQKLLKETRQRRMEERKKERKDKRRQDWLKAKEEAEQRKKEEEERRKREAEEQGRKPMTDGRFAGRRNQPREDYEEADGDVKGADADRWDRQGPLQAPPGQAQNTPRQETERPWRGPPRTEEPRQDPRRGAPVRGAGEEETNWRQHAPPPEAAGDEQQPPYSGRPAYQPPQQRGPPPSSEEAPVDGKYRPPQGRSYAYPKREAPPPDVGSESDEPMDTRREHQPVPLPPQQTQPYQGQQQPYEPEYDDYNRGGGRPPPSGYAFQGYGRGAPVDRRPPVEMDRSRMGERPPSPPPLEQKSWREAMGKEPQQEQRDGDSYGYQQQRFDRGPRQMGGADSYGPSGGGGGRFEDQRGRGGRFGDGGGRGGGNRYDQGGQGGRFDQQRRPMRDPASSRADTDSQWRRNE